MAISTEYWTPQSCDCTVNHRFEETDPDKITTYCSQVEAELIRREKHERLVLQYTVDRDDAQLQGRLRWWRRQGPLEQTTCPDHTGLVGETLYVTLQDESARQNIAWNIVAVTRADLEYDDVRFTWTGQDAGRVLTLQFPAKPVSVEDRGSIQAAADLQFGAGKVLVG